MGTAARPENRRPPALWTIAWGLSLLLARWHIELLGAETMVVLGCLAISGALAFERKRMLTAGLLAALAASMRFDAVLGCGVLGLALWLKKRSFPLRFFVGTLPALATVAWVTLYFGSPLPQTLDGKQGEGLCEFSSGLFHSSRPSRPPRKPRR